MYTAHVKGIKVLSQEQAIKKAREKQQTVAVQLLLKYTSRSKRLKKKQVSIINQCFSGLDQLSQIKSGVNNFPTFQPLLIARDPPELSILAFSYSCLTLTLHKLSLPPLHRKLLVRVTSDSHVTTSNDNFQSL